MEVKAGPCEFDTGLSSTDKQRRRAAGKKGIIRCRELSFYKTVPQIEDLVRELMTS